MLTDSGLAGHRPRPEHAVRFVRQNTFDAAIAGTVVNDYRLPERFAPGDVVLDLGCHIGAFAVRAAERGARVVGYEASRANCALARMNTAHLESVEVRWGAVWRSDVEAGSLRLTPHPEEENTGGASVLFPDSRSHRRFFDAPSTGAAARRISSQPGPVPAHAVPAVSLDAVLRELGHVRLLKIDVEGAEFPILLTAEELGRVDEIVGEIHEMTEAQMARLPAGARVGRFTYDRQRLQSRLGEAGFAVCSRDNQPPYGLFWARRPGREA